MHMNKFRVSLFEIVIVVVIFVILARYIWAKELLEFENSLFSELDVDPSVKYLFTVPLFLLLVYFYYKRDTQRVVGTGRPVVSKWVIVFSGTSVVLVLFYLYFFVGGVNA